MVAESIFAEKILADSPYDKIETMEVIPAINCLDIGCVEEKLKVSDTFLPKDGWIHLDVADARFTFNKTWGDPSLWLKFKNHFHLEVHLMVEEPEKAADEWIKSGAKRLIVHVETLTREAVAQILKMSREHGVEAMLSSNPHTSKDALKPYLKFFSSFQVLSVNPGYTGQPFLPLTLEKVKFLREASPDAKIEVDGGINREIAKLAKAAGANILAAASHIFGAKDPKKAYEELKRI
ncbi:MAG: ribulose-phosphate 3-epimerase [Candidatus Liptonbacteria bacterium]|nr:ribulose-phosphate 3-epimerase [Candidatus Liptonbacteria bacterium]